MAAGSSHNAGCWLAAGYWLPCWLLAAGYWLLAGCWLLPLAADWQLTSGLKNLPLADCSRPASTSNHGNTITALIVVLVPRRGVDVAIRRATGAEPHMKAERKLIAQQKARARLNAMPPERI